jgi:hypothetical protein
MRSCLFPLLLAAACSNPNHGGTAVGNPTGLTVDTAPGTSVVFTSASAPVASLSTVSCAGDRLDIPVGRELDLLGADILTVFLEDSCAVRVAFDGPLELQADGPEGSTLSLELSLDELDLDLEAPGALPRAVLLLGEPGWVDAGQLDLEAGGEESVQPGDPHHNQLVAQLRGKSGLYRDLDADGRCQDEDCWAQEIPSGDTTGGSDGEGSR